MSSNCPKPLTLFTKKQLLFSSQNNSNSVNDRTKKRTLSYIVRNAASAGISRKTREALTFCAFTQNILLFGGEFNADGAVSEKYVFDPNNILTDWNVDKQLNIARNYLSGTTYKNKIYAIGGVNFISNTKLNSIEIYDFINNPTWETPLSTFFMNFSRSHHDNIVLDDFIYVVGGQTLLNNAVEFIEPIERFNGTSFTQLDSSYDLKNGVGDDFAQKRCEHSLVTFTFQNKSRIFLIGGVDDSSNNLNTVYYLNEESTNPEGLRWWKHSTMNEPRRGAACVVYKGILYVIGGATATTGTTPTNSVTYLVLNSTVWQVGTSCKLERFGGRAIVFNDLLYVFGGSTNQMEYFDGTNWNVVQSTNVSHTNFPGFGLITTRK